MYLAVDIDGSLVMDPWSIFIIEVPDDEYEDFMLRSDSEIAAEASEKGFPIHLALNHGLQCPIGGHQEAK